MSTLTKVVVYGTLMEGERYAKYLGNIPRTPCSIRGHLYDTLMGYPVFVPDTSAHEVKAELIEVDDKQLQLLDYIEQYPTLYNRAPIKVTLPGSEPTEVEALIYLFTDEIPLWMPEIRTDWRTYSKVLQRFIIHRS